MQLHWVDWSFILLYCAIAFGIGVYFSRRASQNIDEFFVAGRNLPWWLAGTSIVATTFAADTPLAVSGFVRSQGIYRNWIWWNVLMGGMLCVFFYARLWRRAGIITDVEFVELRYEGRPAAMLRGFLAVFHGVLRNCITMGWVILAMAKICDVMLGWPKVWSIGLLLLLAFVYTVMSGFWGVVMTDLVQFIMAMTGSIALAGIVIFHLGGTSGMVAQVSSAPGVSLKVFHMIPDFSTASEMALISFLVMVCLQWWAGGQGSGYVVQRLFSTKDETHSMLAALWFNIANYVLRPWPWIVVGLASLAFFPITADNPSVLALQLLDDTSYRIAMDPELAYPQMMVQFLPIGLRGLMVASLLAAFMSTMDTHLNWGASYLVNDLYKRFVRTDADEQHYVWVARVAMFVLMILAAVTAWQFNTIEGAWIYLIVLTAGIGFVHLLRWYWWRVNAWSELSALVASFVIANGALWGKMLRGLGLISHNTATNIEWFYGKSMFPIRLAVIIASCTLIWVVVTWLTQPHKEEHLLAFYERVQPGGWWGPIAARAEHVTAAPAWYGWGGWLAGVVCIYAALFGVGYWCLARPWLGSLWLAVSLIAGWMMIAQVRRQTPAS
jgi:SSS family solute:Na+ symporter